MRFLHKKACVGVQNRYSLPTLMNLAGKKGLISYAIPQKRGGTNSGGNEMPYYETVFIARQDLTDAQVKTMTESFCKIITDTDTEGKIHKTEFWGLKPFAYRINKARKGHYVLLELDTTAAALHEMERQMGLHEDVVRLLTIREEALSTGPSVMLEKYDRDEDSKPVRRSYNDDDDDDLKPARKPYNKDHNNSDEDSKPARKPYNKRESA